MTPRARTNQLLYQAQLLLDVAPGDDEHQGARKRASEEGALALFELAIDALLRDGQVDQGQERPRSDEPRGEALAAALFAAGRLRSEVPRGPAEIRRWNPCIIDLSPPSAAAMLPLCRPRKTAPPGLRGWLRRPPAPLKKAHTSPIPMVHRLIGMPAPPANGERKRVGSGSPGVMDLRLEPGEGEALAVGCGRGLCSTVPPRHHPLGRAAQSRRGCSQPAPRAPKASRSP